MNNPGKKKGNQEKTVKQQKAQSNPVTASLKDILCPFKLNLKNLNQIKFESPVPRYSRTFFANTLPMFLKFGEFLKPLYNFGNSNTSIFIYPIIESSCQANLNEIINNLDIKIAECAKNEDRNNIILHSQKKSEATNLRDEISSGFNSLFEITVLSTIFAKSTDDLDALSEMYGFENARSMVNIKSLWSEQEIGFRSNMPFSQNRLLKNNTFDSYAAATIFPFWTIDSSHTTGIPFGVNIQSNSHIFVDDFSPNLKNLNFFVFGNDSTNKNSAVKLLISRSTTMDYVQNLIIDTKGIYKKLTASFFGQSVKIGPKSKIILNPFDIEPQIIKDEITGKERTIINLDEKIEDVTNVLMTMARGPIKSQYVNNTTYGIIKQAVTEEYSATGITSSPESLYSSQGANLIGTKIVRNRKILPTIGSFYKRIQSNASTNTNIDRKYHYEYLIKYMQDFVKELNGYMSYYDGQTSIDIPAETAIITMDISELDQKFAQPLAAQILMCWTMQKFVNPNSEEKQKANKKRIIFDEPSILIPFSDATNTFYSFASRTSNRNVSLLCVSSNIKDMCNIPRFEMILKDASLKLFMKHNELESEYIKFSFNLTMGEKDFLVSCYKHEGIIMIENTSTQISITPNDFETEII